MSRSIANIVSDIQETAELLVSYTQELNTCININPEALQAIGQLLGLAGVVPVGGAAGKRPFVPAPGEQSPPLKAQGLPAQPAKPAPLSKDLRDAMRREYEIQIQALAAAPTREQRFMLAEALAEKYEIPAQRMKAVLFNTGIIKAQKRAQQVLAAARSKG